LLTIISKNASLALIKGYNRRTNPPEKRGRITLLKIPCLFSLTPETKETDIEDLFQSIKDSKEKDGIQDKIDQKLHPSGDSRSCYHRI
jgi:hypothetical protein